LCSDTKFTLGYEVLYPNSKFLPRHEVHFVPRVEFLFIHLCAGMNVIFNPRFLQKFVPGLENAHPGLKKGHSQYKTCREKPTHIRLDVMITIFYIFRQFSAKKLAFFSKTNVMIHFLHNLALF
jgi:hypothetical protein